MPAARNKFYIILSLTSIGIFFMILALGVVLFFNKNSPYALLLNTHTTKGRVAAGQSISITGCGCLNQANTTYVLQNDVSDDGSCFAITNHDVTLDLNGHTITYDTATPITITNADFENGAGAAADNWDFSNAPNATRISGTPVTPVQVYSGSYAIRFPTPVSDQYLISDDVTLAANTKYSISGMAYNQFGGTVYVELEGTAVRAERSGILYRGYQFFYTSFTTGATPETYKVRVGVSGALGLPAGQIYLDDIQIRPFRKSGIVFGANQALSTMPTDLPCYNDINMSNGSVINGNIVQGQAGSNYGHGVYISANNVTVNNVDITVSGPNSINVNNDQESDGMTILNNTLVNNVTTITSREFFDGAAVYAERTQNSHIHDNIIRGGVQGGISLSDFRGLVTPNSVYNNTINLNTKYTNDFAITVYGDINTSIYGNTINCSQASDGCRGIFTGGGATGTQIYNNTVTVREFDRNTEYNGCEINGAYGVQIEYASNISVYGNTVTALADRCPGYAFRINPWNDAGTITGTNISVHDNTFTGTKSVGSTHEASAALFTSISNSDVLSFYSNTLISNQFWMYLSGNTQNQSFTSNTFQIGTNPTSPYTPLFSYNPAPPGPSSINEHFIDNRYADSAAHDAFENGSFVCQSSSYACAAGGGSAVDKFASYYLDWYLTVSVKGNNNTNIAGATVTIANQSGTQVYAGTTDANGLITTTLPRYKDVGGVRTNYIPYTVSAARSNVSDTIIANLPESQTVTITLPLDGSADLDSPNQVIDLQAS